ncbi:MAG: hypothetical protein AAGD25_29640 [Cyanobacteria bacterium P01_F01_bin.150]
MKQLALTAQGQPVGSLERQITLTRLLGLLTQSRQISRLIRKSEQSQSGGEVYAEALQRLYVYICENIDKFNSERATVTHWALFLFNHRFINQAKQHLSPLTAPSITGVPARRITLADLEQCSAEVNEPSPSTRLREYIEADADGHLRACHIQDHPEVTLQLLLLRRLDDKAWRNISEELGIKLPTLHGFYRRQLRRLTPQFEAYLSL